MVEVEDRDQKVATIERDTPVIYCVWGVTLHTNNRYIPDGGFPTIDGRVGGWRATTTLYISDSGAIHPHGGHEKEIEQRFLSV